MNLNPLIAIDVNSNIDYLTLFKFISSLKRKFKNIDIAFVIGDGSIIKVGKDEVFRISDSFSVIELMKNFKTIIDDERKKQKFNINNLLKLKKELHRSVMIIVSDKKINSSDEIIFTFDGKKIRLLKGN
ncbi:hypothetical protein [Acidianus manzaensis]|uniref:Uncharacterized protein n=1 Tax=Acidianus manzaensis TaxID=282676 RepID=A0A1W6K3R6_9CREN|nr:hypothetical protein [Acidianus manzaensis]ARM77092.1 hypothetical protein B6F84_06375 [Acidianus manzaensis]